jgi:hypothetical protein
VWLLHSASSASSLFAVLAVVGVAPVHGLQTPPDFKVLGSPEKVDKPLVWVLGACRDRFLEQ